MQSSSRLPPSADRDQAQGGQKGKNTDPALPTQANKMEQENHAPKQMPLLPEAALVELVETGRFSDLKFLAGWLYRKEKESFSAYFENEVTLRDEVSKADTCFLTRRYSQNDCKRDRARRTAHWLIVINLKVPVHMKKLLNTASTEKVQWTSINYVHDLARLNPKWKNALAEDWETISTLLIRLLTGVNWKTDLKIIVVLRTLAEVYMGKLVIAKLGGFQILTQAVLLRNTRVEVKREAFLLLRSLCEATENVGCFLKDDVAEAVLLELSTNGSKIVDEFTLLVTTVNSETIL